MQNNIFQLPINDNEQTRPEASPVEVAPASLQETAPQVVNTQLGQLSVEFEAAGQRILESDRKNEWKEASNLSFRELQHLGNEIENARTAIETSYDLAA